MSELDELNRLIAEVDAAVTAAAGKPSEKATARSMLAQVAIVSFLMRKAKRVAALWKAAADGDTEALARALNALEVKENRRWQVAADRDPYGRLYYGTVEFASKTDAVRKSTEMIGAGYRGVQVKDLKVKSEEGP